MNFPVVQQMKFMKLHQGKFLDLASSGVHGPKTVADLGIDLSRAPLGNLNPYGYPPLREWLSHRFGVPFDCLAIAPGASMANFLVLSLLLERGDAAVVETPAYEPFHRMVEGITGKAAQRLRRRRDAGYRLEGADLPGGLENAKLLVIANLHNPTGLSEPDETLIRIADKFAGAGGYILVDEIFRPFIPGEEWRTSAVLHNRIIATGSLTKAWGLSGLRIGWIIAAPDIIARIQAMMDCMHVIQSIITEYAALQVLESGIGDRLLNRAQTIAQSHLPIVEQFLAAMPQLRWVKPEGAISALVWFKDGRSSDELCDLLVNRFGTLVVPGRFFDVPDGFRLGFGSAESELRRGLEALNNVMEIIS